MATDEEYERDNQINDDDWGYRKGQLAQREAAAYKSKLIADNKSKKRREDEAKDGLRWIRAAHKAYPYYANRKILVPGSKPRKRQSPFGDKSLEGDFVSGLAVQTVLRELAGRANDKAGIFPSYDNIGHFTGLSHTTIGKCIKVLQADGLLRVQHRPNTSNKYTLHVTNMLALEIPFLTDKSQAILGHFNQYVVSEANTPADQRDEGDRLATAADFELGCGDVFIYEVLEWFLERMDKGLAHEAGLGHCRRVDPKDGGDGQIIFRNFRSFMTNSYPYIRAAYIQQEEVDLPEFNAMFDSPCVREYLSYCLDNNVPFKYLGRDLTPEEERTFLKRTQPLEEDALGVIKKERY
jgi:hypothetical protein